MGRSPCCEKQGLKRGAWTPMEDKILIEYIKVHGEGRWRSLPKRAGLKRCGKSCRLRWLNYLRPDIKRGNITPDEEELIIRLHRLLGNRWSLIAGRLPGRTDNEIKNYWNTNLCKRVLNSHNHPYQPNTTLTYKKSGTKSRKTISNDRTTTEPTDSNVVRTKAVRCTKSFIMIDANDHHYSFDRANTGLVLEPSSMDDRKNDDRDRDPDPDPDPDRDESSSSPPQPCNFNNASIDVDIHSEFMGDFRTISELLNSEFSGVCDFSYDQSSKNRNDLSPGSVEHHPFVLSQELLEDWLGERSASLV